MYLRKKALAITGILVGIATVAYGVYSNIKYEALDALDNSVMARIMEDMRSLNKNNHLLVNKETLEGGIEKYTFKDRHVNPSDDGLEEGPRRVGYSASSYDAPPLGGRLTQGDRLEGKVFFDGGFNEFRYVVRNGSLFPEIKNQSWKSDPEYEKKVASNFRMRLWLEKSEIASKSNNKSKGMNIASRNNGRSTK